MPKIHFIEPDGSHRTVDAKTGISLMQNAVSNNIAGIFAECGGACACATCKVVVDPSWRARIPAPDAMESSMLDDGDENIRLSCQIKVTEELDGLTVRVSSSQH